MTQAPQASLPLLALARFTWIKLCLCNGLGLGFVEEEIGGWLTCLRCLMGLALWSQAPRAHCDGTEDHRGQKFRYRPKGVLPQGVPRIFDAFLTHFWRILECSSFPNKTRPILTHVWRISDTFLTHSCYCRRLFRKHLLDDTENWTQFFFSNFSGAAGISHQNPVIFRPKSLISLASRDIPNFLAPIPSRGRPLPHRKISGLKSLGLRSFSCLRSQTIANRRDFLSQTSPLPTKLQEPNRNRAFVARGSVVNRIAIACVLSSQTKVARLFDGYETLRGPKIGNACLFTKFLFTILAPPTPPPSQNCEVMDFLLNFH